jgi:hypothetical protein
MLQSKEGSKITDQATKILHPNHVFAGEDEESDSEQEKVKVDPLTLFPEIKSEALAPFQKTGLKLAFEEDTICERMIKKYRDDTDRMHRDIKINYLQWSEGQIK